MSMYNQYGRGGDFNVQSRLLSRIGLGVINIGIGII